MRFLILGHLQSIDQGVRRKTGRPDQQSVWYFLRQLPPTNSNANDLKIEGSVDKGTYPFLHPRVLANPVLQP